MAITIFLIYLFIADMVAYNAYRGAKRTMARLAYITWHGALRFTLRDSKGRFISNHAGFWELAKHGGYNKL